MSNQVDHVALTEQVFYILLALHRPLHGYGIMQFVNEMTGGRVNLGPGTLYGALNTLEEKAWIEMVDMPKDSRRKEYRITAAGKNAIVTELRRLEELLTNGQRVVGGKQS